MSQSARAPISNLSSSSLSHLEAGFEASFLMEVEQKSSAWEQNDEGRKMFANCVQVTVVKRKCEHLLACLGQQNTLSGLPLWYAQDNLILNFFPSKIWNLFIDHFNTLVPGTFCSMPSRLLLLPIHPQSLALPHQLQNVKTWIGVIKNTCIDSQECKTSWNLYVYTISTYMYWFTITQSEFEFIYMHNQHCMYWFTIIKNDFQICIYSWIAPSHLAVLTHSLYGVVSSVGQFYHVHPDPGATTAS